MRLCTKGEKRRFSNDLKGFRAGAEAHDWHGEYPIWMTPVLGEAPWPIGVIDPAVNDVDAREEKLRRYMPFTALQNATGQPAICVPITQTDNGLPIGVQFVGRVGEEALLLQLAAEMERAYPQNFIGAQRQPPIWAGNLAG